MGPFVEGTRGNTELFANKATEKCQTLSKMIFENFAFFPVDDI